MSKPTPKEFIAAWQSSSSVKEVAEKLGMKPKTASSRASFYKSKGIPLKRMSGGRAIDWDEMKEYAQSLEEGGEEDER